VISIDDQLLPKVCGAEVLGLKIKRKQPKDGLDFVTGSWLY
jgi:hypothetical protein